MTVKQLIEKLQEFDPELEVFYLGIADNNIIPNPRLDEVALITPSLTGTSEYETFVWWDEEDLEGACWSL